MQEQDDLLAEIIREMREERGRTKGFDDARFRERVEILGPEISLEKLRKAISTSCKRLSEDNPAMESFITWNCPVSVATL